MQVEFTVRFKANSALNLLAGTGLEVDLAGLRDRWRCHERQRIRVIRHRIASESKQLKFFKAMGLTLGILREIPQFVTPSLRFCVCAG